MGVNPEALAAVVKELRGGGGGSGSDLVMLASFGGLLMQLKVDVAVSDKCALDQRLFLEKSVHQ